MTSGLLSLCARGTPWPRPPGRRPPHQRHAAPPVRWLSEVNCYIDCRRSSPDWMCENNVPYDFTIVKAPGLEWPRGFLLIINA